MVSGTTHFRPESDGSKTKCRSRRTKRRSRDDEGVALDCRSVTFDPRDAVSKHEDTITKRNVALAKRSVALTIQGVAFSIARAPFAIRSESLSSVVRHSRNQAALSQFIGRDYRFEVRLCRRKRATSNSLCLFSGENERRSIHEGTLTIHLLAVETKQHVHERGKAQSKWLPSKIQCIGPQFHSRCPPRWRTSSRTARASCTR